MVRLDQGGVHRHLRLISPPPALARSVEHFWIWGAGPHPVWRVVPDLCGYLIFSVSTSSSAAGSAVSAQCRVVGARSRFCDVPTAGRSLTIGARLRPGALAHFLREPASVLTDHTVGLDQIVGRAGARLLDQMLGADRAQRLPILAQFLTDRLRDAGPAMPAHWIDNDASVHQLARDWGRSRRGLYDRFLCDVGLAPKTALRVARLQRALFALNGGAALSAAALHAGYCDQAHFTREASGLLGESPAAWARRGCSNLQDASAGATP